MGVFKEILHSLAGIWADVKTIKECQSPNLKKKADRFDSIVKSLDDIHLNVSKVYSKIDDEGRTTVYVEYAPISAKIVIGDTEDGNEWDKEIVAINNLNLISYEDMRRISNVVEYQNKSSS